MLPCLWLFQLVVSSSAKHLHKQMMLTSDAKGDHVQRGVTLGEAASVRGVAMLTAELEEQRKEQPCKAPPSSKRFDHSPMVFATLIW